MFAMCALVSAREAIPQDKGAGVEEQEIAGVFCVHVPVSVCIMSLRSATLWLILVSLLE